MTLDHSPREPNRLRGILYDLILLGIVMVGAYFRLIGYQWGEYNYLHPDERFLLMVGADITPIKEVTQAPDGSGQLLKKWISLGEYFDTANSPLNPNNRGHNFYVYGTLPLFLTRILAELSYEHVGLQEMQDIGRPLSALSDLLVVVLVYLIAARLHSRRAGLLAAAFYAAAVLPIQLSHFFKEDTFTNFFVWLAIFCAVMIATAQNGYRLSSIEDRRSAASNRQPDIRHTDYTSRIPQYASRFIRHPCFFYSVGFGVALGSAVASKLNAVPVAILLPAAFAIPYFRAPREERGARFKEAVGFVIVGAVVSLLIFRLFQPYAFSGPGFFGVKPNQLWIDQIRSQRDMAAGDVDFPPALQWARRPIWFSGQNLTVWGLGLPLGLLAWAGFLWAGWRSLHGEWPKHLLLWGWLAFYFTWQTFQFNPTMRYQLPSYPALAIFAAWAVFALVEGYKLKVEGDDRTNLKPSTFNLQRIGGVIAGTIVLMATFAWAYAFTRIYTRPITRIEASRWIYQNIPGPINLRVETAHGLYNQPLPFYPYETTVEPGLPYETIFTARASGQVSEIYLDHVVDLNAVDGEKTLAVKLLIPGQAVPPGVGTVTASFLPEGDPRGQGYTLRFDHPVTLVAGELYTLAIELQEGEGALRLAGETVANEGDWDDGIPYPVDGYNAMGGIYPQEVNFNMYTGENEEKLAHFLDILDRSDYLFITSNRQWGVLPRLPERFPMSTIYYRALLGCPAERSISWCYNVAQPGAFRGELGYELIKVFQSEPEIGPLRINTQFAEEAFTVYDHPKVFIFKKSVSYDPRRVQELLGVVDFTKVMNITPKKAGTHPADLMLPSERLAAQRAGGTWSEYFNPRAIQNRFQPVGVTLWYLAVFLLGLAAYPLLRLALPGLADRGYPLARIAGLLILAYLVWLGGSLNIPVSRPAITVAFLLLAATGGWLAYRQRDGLRLEWRENRRYFLLVEGLFLAFFLFDLLIRFGNPDLWHQWKGGEKPMDFAYFNAVIKSTSYPPYDPWFAGGYLNYYYYGFVLVGVLVKWLGIVPAFAYNLILPTIFSLIAMGAFSAAWNIFAGGQKEHSAVHHPPIAIRTSAGLVGAPPGEPEPVAAVGRLAGDHEALAQAAQPENRPAAPGTAVADRRVVPAVLETPDRHDNLQPATFHSKLVTVAVAAALAMALLGNLGTLRMIWQGYQRLGSPTGQVEDAGFLTRNVWAVRGLFASLGGETLPYSVGDWYWNPSRVIPPQGDVEPITEFPFFTVLYADPHAHLFALPVALLALSWAISVVMARGRWQGIAAAAAGFGLGGLAIGALYPINLSDIYTYLPLGLAALVYTLWRYFEADGATHSTRTLGDLLPPPARRIALTAGGVLALGGLAMVFYRPYAQWYGQPYSSISLWSGPLTPLNSYLTHWGLFLFVIVTWMIWETRDWMASTPLSALRKLEPYRDWILIGLAALAGAILLLQGWAITRNHWTGVHIAWLALPLAAWAGVLLLRPGMPDAKRLVLFLIGTGLLITVMVEVVVVRGDIGRMNTVFKFYLHVWTLFAVSAAAALGWLLSVLPAWLRGWRVAWQAIFGFLAFSACLFTLLGTTAKIRDRFIDTAPHTLDGMAYMEYVRSFDNWGIQLDLNQDYHAIRWMQDHVQGSPVIVEASPGGDQYRWYSRVSIYTGLPAVIGWQWHQMQQRELVPDSWVIERDFQVEDFYTTTDPEQARAFLRKYNVGYIILGQLERGRYPGPGLDKFTEQEGVLWRQVYSDRDTAIYQVIR